MIKKYIYIIIFNFWFYIAGFISLSRTASIMGWIYFKPNNIKNVFKSEGVDVGKAYNDERQSDKTSID